MKLMQKFKTALNVAVSVSAVVIILSMIGLAADRNVIIGYHKPVGDSEDENVRSHGGTVEKDFKIINAILAKVPENRIEELKKDSTVAYVVNDSVFEAADEYSSAWGVQYIGSQVVHNQNIDGTGVKIAVLDTGIDYNHPDLAANYKGGFDFVNNDTDPWDDNCLSYYRTCHGTHVSGTIAAIHNGIGVVGVAPGADIYAVKVLDGGGFGSASLVVSGLEWAKNNGMNIISMSLGSPENNSAVMDAVNAAYNSGILLVAAGGNTYGTSVLYPAAYDSVIAVAAVDQNGMNASFSPRDPKIEIAAPGVDINSTVQGGYGILRGTSMAAPHVTGVAALIFSTNYPDVNGDGKRDNRDVREILRNSAFDTGVPGRDDLYGYGIVDASGALFGISAFSNADLSITKDDGESDIAAGDGRTHTYIITVRNNGPSDAPDVIVSDIWPAEFVRGAVSASSGTCDTATSPANFTCNLGSIVKDGSATVAVNYTVPSDTTQGNYTNRVEVRSTASDPNPANNVAEDKNIVYGISAYADLSITKDDGESDIAAGDGRTHTYIITVRNNGPSDASNVIISDIWPAGFVRGIVSASSGTCDTATSPANFTCSLGSIVKDGSATVAVNYTVPSDTAPGNYTNRVEVRSTTSDPNPANNIAEDKNIVYVRLTIIRTKGSSDNDVKNVSLSQGNYSINITNINLSKIEMKVYENGVFKPKLSSEFEFKGYEIKNIEMAVPTSYKIYFKPEGRTNSTGYITIRRLS